MAKRQTKKHVQKTDISVTVLIRDVLVAGMNKGQLPQATAALVFVFIAWRMPPNDVTELVTKFLNRLADWSVTGWVLAAITLMVFGLLNKGLRSRHAQEVTRLSDERNHYQRIVLGDKLGSSKP